MTAVNQQETAAGGSNKSDVKLLVMITLVGIGVAALVTAGTQVDLWSLESAYGDLAATAEVSPFLGVVSTVGGMLWVSATAIALFSGWLLVRSQGVREGKFLIYFGALSLLLAIDDIFQLHERVLGQIPNLGQPLYLAL